MNPVSRYRRKSCFGHLCGGMGAAVAGCVSVRWAGPLGAYV